MRVLIVEDFVPLREAMVQGLSEAGFAVDAVGDGEAGLWHGKSGEHDVIVLDLMLPRMNGMTVLRELRRAKSASRVLVLTAKGAAEERIAGLENGADDYLGKPFVFRELVARVRALVRRKYEARGTEMRVGDLVVDLSRREVRRGDRKIDLSGREFALLEYLALNHGRVVTRADIAAHVYDFNASLESNVIDVFVGLLRKKIEEPGKGRLLHTKRGVGYMLGCVSAEEAE